MVDWDRGREEGRKKGPRGNPRDPWKGRQCNARAPSRVKGIMGRDERDHLSLLTTFSLFSPFFIFNTVNLH